MDSTLLENNRNKRLFAFEDMSALKSPFGHASSFGMGRSAWGTDEHFNIWRSADRFIEPASDQASRQSAGSYDLRNGRSSSTKTGSSSLLATSDLDPQPRRTNTRWNSSTFVKEPMLSSLPNDMSSSGHQQAVEAVGRSQISSMQPPVESLGSFAASSASQSGQRSAWCQPFKVSEIADFKPSTANQIRYQDFNGSASQANGLSSWHPASFGDLPYNYRTQTSAEPPAPSENEHNGADYSLPLLRLPNDLAPGQTPLTGPFTRQSLYVQPPPAMAGTQPPQNLMQNQLTDAFGNLRLNDGGALRHSGPTTHSAAVRPHRTNHTTRPRAEPVYTDSLVQSETEGDSNAKPASNGTLDHRHQGGLAHLNSVPYGSLPATSPTASDYRPGLPSPYSTTGTPPTSSDSFRSLSRSNLSSRTSLGHASALERKLHGLENGSQQGSFFQNNSVNGRSLYAAPPGYDYTLYPPASRANHVMSRWLLPGPTPITGARPTTTTYADRDHDPSQIVRSALLEEFRTNSKTNKRYELRDIFNYVVEFSGDQHGSRFIQQKLETANSDEKEQIFAEILPNAIQLMTDVFGNYVVQKLFEHGNQAQKKMLANQMRGHVLTLSLQMYGCRVVQKALEHILTDQQASMVKELEGQVLRCVKDQNGNHVIQKAIERVPAEHIQFIVTAFHREVQRLATHPYGCRVIQRMLEHCRPDAKYVILAELRQCVPLLITDQFGNYVIQHVIENGSVDDKRSVVSTVQSQLLLYSRHKFASNVVEKSIEFAEEPQRRQILDQLITSNEKGEGPVLGLMRDQYGNYVIQKVLGQLQGAERDTLVNQIKSQLPNLRRMTYGKQILAIEKLIFDSEHHSQSFSSHSSELPSTTVSTSVSITDEQTTPPRFHTGGLGLLHGQVALPLAAVPQVRP